MSSKDFIEKLQPYATELYSEEEMTAVEEHIQTHFGQYDHVFHEVMSESIHLDVCVIPPEDDRPYYTLVTLGMGAHRMNVPEDLRGKGLERAELMITLPADWQMAGGDLRWEWPVHLLRSTARLPIMLDTWVGWGHTVDNGEPFSPDTELCASILVSPQQGFNELNLQGNCCILPNGEEVNFYHLIPIYRNEMEFKKIFGADLMIEYALAEVSHVVDEDRADGCAGWQDSEVLESILENMDEDALLDSMEMLQEMEMQCQDMMIDDGQWHLDNLREKELPVDELNAYSHIAIYLRWCMEHDLLNQRFFFRFVNELDEVRENGFRRGTDFRKVVRSVEDINGCLIKPYFNERGVAFAEYYYDQNSNHCYPEDIDEYAQQYILKKYGRERLESGEFQDEEYLFVPFDEEYYQGMKKYMDRTYYEWMAAYAGQSEGLPN